MPFVNMYLERNGDYIACGHSMTGDTNSSNVGTVDVDTAWNDEYFRNLRLDLINGVKNKNCQICWDREERNMRSARQEFNEAYKDIVDMSKVVEEAKNNNGAITPSPKLLGLKGDNVCNLKCITCNHYQSSQHEKEVKIFRERKEELPKWLTTIEEINKGNFYVGDYIVSNLNSLLRDSIKLEIQGGEPLISPITHEILDYCIDNGYTDINLTTLANLTSLTDPIIEKIKKFPNMELWISWDHIVEDKFRFIRYPASYAMFRKNLKKLVDAGHTRLGISFTISIFNCFDIPDILNEFENTANDLGIEWMDVVFRLVYQPDYFSIEYLEDEQKVILINKLDNYINTYKDKHKILSQNKQLVHEIVNSYKIINTAPDDFIEVVKERTRVLKLYDELRRTNYKLLFPFIKDYE